jgi:tRNA(Ile)-lysidine synthase
MATQRKIDWRKVADVVAAAIPPERLHPAVIRWTDAEPQRQRWWVALSGGADSVALLLLVWSHWPERRPRLCALHFDHRLRGASAARADLVFCRRLCRSLGVRLIEAEWIRPKTMVHPSEADARAARMQFFEKHSRVLWLGHHQDDVAETMLMRLARGSGASGLAAPRPVQPMPAGRVHLRPLLAVTKFELSAQLRAAGASWREDSTNAGPAYFRNRIRRDVIPAWVAAAGRDAVAGAARSRELLAEDDAALETIVDRLRPIGAAGDLLLTRLTSQPRAIFRRALHRWVAARSPKVDLSRQAFEALLDAIRRGKPTRHSIGSELFAVLRRGRLHCEARNQRGKFQRRVN